ncbi:hypothetical protein [Acinetobacter sp. B51(2017)]|uniref:hypothetical protein n=1 Tax=Acinetobacter sp. B51(2017) TaxID=2060938 RepID=UPI000F08EEBA|nr:hypothetical protein [Acinetobacter sp. B51(2017)]
MYEERYAKAISLGYKFLEEDDNGGAVYVKNGLKWIENYADLAKTLQKNKKIFYPLMISKINTMLMTIFFITFKKSYLLKSV